MISESARWPRAAGLRLLVALVAPLVGFVSVAMAQTSGSWTNAISGGLWSGAGNWAAGTVADGSGATAYFTNDITANNTVHLDTARTIGNLTFGDGATNTPASWFLDNNGSAANILTLAGATPTITVNALGANKIDRSATIGAEIAGSGGFTKAGVGMLILTASNSYSGPTTVSGGGILYFTNSGALGSTNGATTVQAGNQLRLSGGITVAEPLTISGSVADAMGRGALRSHSGSNVWTGPITVAGASETWINAAGGSITLTGGITSTNAGLRLDQGTFLVTGNPIKLGTGGLGVNSSARLAVASNTFSTLRIDWGGNLRTEVAGALPTNVSLIIGAGGPSGAGAGTLNLSGYDTTIGRLADGGTNYAGEVINNATNLTAATLTINQSLNSTFRGRLLNNLGLTKGGEGTLTLGGSNTYSGATTVSGGILLVNGSHVGGGQYTVESAATLGGTGMISSALASLTGGIVAPGNSIGTLTFNGNADLDGTLQIELDSSGFGSSDLLVVTGSLDITSATVDFFLLAGAPDDDAYVFATYGTLLGSAFGVIQNLPDGYGIDYNYLGGNSIALVIPEPSTFLLLGLGALALLGLRSGCRKKQVIR